jgi:hypothetical protein
MTTKRPCVFVYLTRFVFFFSLPFTYGQSLELDSTWWFTNGKVNSIVKDSLNNQVYLGGEFSYLGPEINNGAIFNLNNTESLIPTSNINGSVKSAIPDGANGWYLGGDFTMIGDSVRERIAHIDELGNVTNRLTGISFSNTVNSLILADDKLIVGGKFLQYGNNQRFAVELTTSSELSTPSFPEINNYVNVSISDGSGGWFIGGNFSTVGDSLRQSFAHILSDGSVSAWSVPVNGSINVMSRTNDTLIIGGNFTSVNGVNRNNIAMLDINSAQLLNWNPVINGTVNAIHIALDQIFVGGTFTDVGGQNRIGFASFIHNTGTLSAWNLDLDGEVLCIKSSNNSVYLGGNFTMSYGQVRNRILAINGTSGSLSNWNPNSNNKVYDIVLKDGLLYVGGQFTNIGGQNQNKFATIDSTSGLLVNNGLYGNGIIFKLHLVNDTLYVVGDFTEFKNTPRYDVAAVNLTTSSVLPWCPTSNSGIGTISTFGNKVFLGGSFTMIGNPNTAYLVAINKYTGQSTNWNIATNLGVNNNVTALLFNQGRLYVGGAFSSIGGFPRSNLAVIDSLNGNVLSTIINVNSGVSALAANSTNLYIGGSFTQISGQTRNRIGSISLSSNLVTAWSPNADFAVLALAANDNNVYVGGQFSNIGGSIRNCLASVNSSTGIATSWNPNPQNFVSGENEYVNALKIQNDTLFVGGEFNVISTSERKKNAAFNLTGSLLSWTLHCNGTIYTIAKNNGEIFLGGSYNSIGGYVRKSLASINTITGKATQWNPNLDDNGEVNNLNLYGNTVYVVGDFESIGGQIRYDVGSINASTGNVTSWNPNPSSMGGFILGSAIANNFLFVGGDFSSIGSQNRSSIAAIDINTATISPWNPNANNDVFCLYPDVANNTIYVGGQFTNIGGQTRNRLAELNLTTGNATSFNPNVNNDVYSIQKSGNEVYFSGIFSLVGGFPRNRIASVISVSGALNSFNTSNTLWPYISGLFKLLIRNDILYSVGNENKLLKYDLINNSGEYFTIPNSNYQLALEVDNSRIYLGHWAQKGFSPYTTCEITYSDITEFACDSLVLSGLTYYSSGIFQQVILNSLGCDSVITLNLTILPSTSSIDYQLACDSLSWIDGNTYYSSTNSPTWILQNSNGCDSLITLNLSINQSNTGIDYQLACDSLTWIDGITYYLSTNTPTWVLQNSTGCDSLITLNLIIEQGIPTNVENMFSLPSSDLICNGSFAVEISGNPDFELTTNSITQSTSGYSLFTNLCPGVNDLQILNSCGDTTNIQYIVPIDSNYVLNNAFLDSLAQDSLGVTLTNCEIYYNNIDTAFIDSIWAVGNNVTVIWNIVDSNGSNYDTTSYVLNNGSGVFWLQLSIFCPTKALGEYFTVTEAVYFDNGNVSLANLYENESANIQVFPNPTDNTVTVTFGGNEARIKIFDIQGKLLFDSVINTNETIDLYNFESGIYWFKIETDYFEHFELIFKN